MKISIALPSPPAPAHSKDKQISIIISSFLQFATHPILSTAENTKNECFPICHQLTVLHLRTQLSWHSFALEPWSRQHVPSVGRISVFPSPLSCVRPVFVSHTFIYLKCDRAVSFTIIHLTCKRNCISSVHDIAVVILADSTKRIMRCTK